MIFIATTVLSIVIVINLTLFLYDTLNNQRNDVLVWVVLPLKDNK